MTFQGIDRSKYHGIRYEPRGVWLVRVKYKQKLHYLRSFVSEEDAARYSDVVRIFLAQRQKKLNFDGNPPQNISKMDILRDLFMRGVIDADTLKSIVQRTKLVTPS